jgi:hypothetical protein
METRRSMYLQYNTEVYSLTTVTMEKQYYMCL